MYHFSLVMCFHIAVNGEDKGQGTHLSLYIHLMEGKNDDKLSWPLHGEKTDPRGEYGACVTGLAPLLSGRQYRGYGFKTFYYIGFLSLIDHIIPSMLVMMILYVLG